MKELRYYILVPALILAGALIYLGAEGTAKAGTVQQQVVRFHVVAASNDPQAQQLKLLVRDGLFARLEQLFAPCTDSEQVLRVAAENRTQLESRAQEILRENGSEERVQVEVGTGFFPTKSYGDYTFPAGRYQGVSVRIGSAQGENFWCVLYPALCVAPAVADAKADAQLIAVVGEEGVSLLKQEQPIWRIRFLLADWWGRVKEKICK